MELKRAINSREERKLCWQKRTGLNMLNYDTNDDSQAGNAAPPEEPSTELLLADAELARTMQAEEDALAQRLDNDRQAAARLDQQLVTDRQAAEQLDRQERAQASQPNIAATNYYAAALQTGLGPQTRPPSHFQLQQQANRQKAAALAKEKLTIQKVEKDLAAIRAAKRWTQVIPPATRPAPPKPANPAPPALDPNEEPLEYEGEYSSSESEGPAAQAPAETAGQPNPATLDPNLESGEASDFPEQDFPADNVTHAQTAARTAKPLAQTAGRPRTLPPARTAGQAKVQPPAQTVGQARTRPPAQTAGQARAQPPAQTAGQNRRQLPAQTAGQAAAMTAQTAEAAAAQIAQPSRRTDADSDSDDPDAYYHLSLDQLSYKQKKRIKKNMKDAVYMNYDQFSKRQENPPELWLQQLHNGLKDSGVNPSHAVAFLNDSHLGEKTAMTMANWIAGHRGASWDEFSQKFLELNVGKPPQVTRLTWKALTMKTSGSYHTYLTEFNRQKALINTGADETIEQFLLGLTPQLRSQVKFYKNRNWHASEFQKLVDITTERVNSSVNTVSTSTAPVASSSAAVKIHERRGTKRTHENAVRERSRHRQPRAQNGRGNAQARADPIYIGRTAEESSAIGQWCWDHDPRLCKYCRSPKHGHKECRRKDNPPPFRFPPDWDEAYWLAESRKNSVDRDKGEAPARKKAKN